MRSRESKLDQVSPSDIMWIQVKSNESKWDQVNQVSLSESKWDQVSPSEIKCDPLSPSESKWHQETSSESKWEQLRSSEPKWVQVRSSEPKWDQVSPSVTSPFPQSSYPTLVGVIGVYIYHNTSAIYNCPHTSIYFSRKVADPVPNRISHILRGTTGE